MATIRSETRNQHGETVQVRTGQLFVPHRTSTPTLKEEDV
jgi:hypothetical protein